MVTYIVSTLHLYVRHIHLYTVYVVHIFCHVLDLYMLEHSEVVSGLEPLNLTPKSFRNLRTIM